MNNYDQIHWIFVFIGTYWYLLLSFLSYGQGLGFSDFALRY